MSFSHDNERRGVNWVVLGVLLALLAVIFVLFIMPSLRHSTPAPVATDTATETAQSITSSPAKDEKVSPMVSPLTGKPMPTKK